jgi:methylated-DNA-[protein]-cysteine S-methyltransferase
LFYLNLTKRLSTIIYNYIESPLGEIELAESEGVLHSCLFVETKRENKIKKPVTDSALFEEAKMQLEHYFAKRLTQFELPLNFQGTVFQQRVWRGLQNITFGSTISYLNLSKQLGDAKAIRAVASANGKNPFAIIVPCHRVIGTDGSLTGYAGDLWRKQWLIAHERNELSLQIELFD